MGFFDFLRKRPTKDDCEAAYGSAADFKSAHAALMAALNGATEITKPGFSLVLPGNGWLEEPYESGFRFVHGLLKLEAIVDSQKTQKCLADPELQEVIPKLVEIRQDALRKTSGGSITIEGADKLFAPGVADMCFVTTSRHTGMSAGAKICGRPNEVVTLSLYMYPNGVFSATYDQVGLAVLSSFKVA